MSDPLEGLTQRLRELGAPDPENWASSELHEDIPQTAAFVAMRNLWPDLIHPWRDPEVLARVPASRALLDAGVAPEVVSKAMCVAAFQGVIGTLWELAGGDETPAGAPWVRLMEVAPDGQLTGRAVGGLHESLLSIDPTGEEGADFL
jgi:hypothetical protein